MYNPAESVCVPDSLSSFKITFAGSVSVHSILISLGGYSEGTSVNTETVCLGFLVI